MDSAEEKSLPQPDRATSEEREVTKAPDHTQEVKEELNAARNSDDEEEEVLFDVNALEESEQERAEKERRETEQEFVSGMVNSMLPIVLACDKQAYAVTSSQEGLLTRVKELQVELEKFTSQDFEALPRLSESTRKLRELQMKLSGVNSTLSAVQTRLNRVTMDLHAHLGS